MTQHIWCKECHCNKEDQEDAKAKAVLRRVIGVERNCVLFALYADAGWVRRPRNVQRPHVQDDDACNNERHQIVQREETVQSRLVWRKAAKQQLTQWFAHQRNCGEEASDNLRPPEAHLAPWKHIAHERGRHHQKEDSDTKQPDHFTRRFVRTVEQTPENMGIHHDKEEACAVHMRIPQEPASIHVTHDMLNAVECAVDACIIMHGKDDAGNNLYNQSDARKDAEIPEIVEIAWNRIPGANCVINEARQGEAFIHPLRYRALRLILLCPREAHYVLAPQPILTTVSERNAYSGTLRFSGAGPFRIRAAVS